jgi:murein DD-endopeptidase MepM/ murein hydrolase activator NlpD
MGNFPASFRYSGLFLVAFGALALSGCAGVKPSNRPPARGSFTTPIFPGDTLASVAKRHQVSIEELIALNTVKNPDRKLARGWVRIPPTTQVRAESIARSVQPVPAPPRAVPVQTRPASIERRALEPLPATPSRTTRMSANSRVAPTAAAVAVESARQAAPPLAQVTEPMWYDWMAPSAAPPGSAAESELRFLWPVSGRIISPFGNRPDGGRNDGINISAERGAPVHAAEGGEVSYVGNELKGYGNLILIRHDNGYTTAYAHADGVLVKRGQHVQRGDVIASAGATGDVSQPQLHFELRRGTRPVDPTLFLGRAEGLNELLAESTR